MREQRAASTRGIASLWYAVHAIVALATLLLLLHSLCRRFARQVPRIALESTTFGDLLFYPAKPGKTVFIISISRIAEATGSLWYTFGSGDEVRSCPFKPFFEGFMGDLQAQLRSGGAAASRAKEL